MCCTDLLPEKGPPTGGEPAVLVGQALQILTGRHAGFPAEHLGKIVGVGKAGGLCHIGDGGVLPLEQELGMFHPKMGDVPSGGDPSLPDGTSPIFGWVMYRPGETPVCRVKARIR